MRRSKRHKRRYLTGPKRIEKGRFECIGKSEMKWRLNKNCGESSTGPTMHWRGRSVNSLKSEDGAEEKSSCGPGRAHQASLSVVHVKYALPLATSLALNPGTPTTFQMANSIFQLTPRHGEVETHRLHRHSTKGS